MEVQLLFLLILCSQLALIASSATVKDTLKQGDVLNSTKSTFLVSANKVFTLGFFTPDTVERTNTTYLAIWFTEEGESPVWIGNRETPLPTNSSTSAKLLIDASGRLMLKNDESRGTPYLLLFSSKQTTLKVAATLLDSGNFVLREVNSGGSFGQELWSSFDYPTDTLLPGMKLGVNHRTGRKWSLTSWRDIDMPASGAYSLEWEPSKHRLAIKYRGVVHWTSGELMNSNNFRYIDSVYFHDHDETFTFLDISTKEESYFSFRLTIDNVAFPLFTREERNRYLFEGWSMDSSGVLVKTSGGVMTDVRECYGYENEAQQSKGCELWEQPKCRGGNNNGQTIELRSGKFTNFTHPTTLGGEFTTDNSSGSSLADCRENCWKDCNCVGFRGSGHGCEYWRGTYLQFQQDDSGRTATQYVLNRPIKKENDSNSKKLIWILIPTVVATTVFTVLLGLLLLCRRRKREEARKEQELKDLLTLEEYTDIHELNNGENSNLKVFSYAWVIATTNNFSSDCKLGQGGFGSVYKGITTEGQEVAIKQLSAKSKQGIMEFKNELVLIAKLQHTNLVKLVGFCIHGNQKMLIYEFMPNKSLDFYLFDPNQNEHLSWERRLDIIEGIAHGLLYLHKYSRVRIIHRDMKASNILLDENMNPKISDFGMAKILRQNATEANTKRLGGTPGYMAPEYVRRGIFSTKSDVYSFGILVLEIVSGKKNNHFRNEDGPLNLVEHAWELWNRDAVLQLVDPAISNLCGNEEQLCRCINIGLLCVEEIAVDRPSMSDVVFMLTNENLALAKPENPAFVSRSVVANRFQAGKPEKFTVNEVSISAMEGR